MNLLLVEDDLNLGKALLKVLDTDYRLEWVRTLASARERYSAEEFQVVLLDLGLPDGDGNDWIRSLRAAGHQTPVLVLSARDEVSDRVGALDLGADDYLIKPFEVDELKARIRVLMRRAGGSAGPRMVMGNLSFAPEEGRFYLGDEVVELTPKEHRLLSVLMQAGERPVNRETLTRQLGSEVASNALEVHIHSLRKLLGRERIETLRGFGYRLRSE